MDVIQKSFSWPERKFCCFLTYRNNREKQERFGFFQLNPLLQFHQTFNIFLKIKVTHFLMGFVSIIHPIPNQTNTFPSLSLSKQIKVFDTVLLGPQALKSTVLEFLFIFNCTPKWRLWIIERPKNISRVKKSASVEFLDYWVLVWEAS